ncbi:hypothetical protein ACVPOY_12330 [Staphylococcus aureus]
MIWIRKSAVSKELSRKLQSELNHNKKLSNENFVSKAPEKVINMKKT